MPYDIRSLSHRARIVAAAIMDVLPETRADGMFEGSPEEWKELLNGSDAGVSHNEKTRLRREIETRRLDIDYMPSGLDAEGARLYRELITRYNAYKTEGGE